MGDPSGSDEAAGATRPLSGWSVAALGLWGLAALCVFASLLLIHLIVGDIPKGKAALALVGVWVVFVFGFAATGMLTFLGTVCAIVGVRQVAPRRWPEVLALVLNGVAFAALAALLIISLRK